MSHPEATLATLNNDGTEPTADQLKIAELEKQVEKLTKQFQGACLEARLAQLRAEHAEKQLDDKRRVREDVEKAIEMANIEELKKKNTDFLREIGELTKELEKVKSAQECLKAENAHLRSRLGETDTAETTTQPLLASPIPPPEDSRSVSILSQNDMSNAPNFTRPILTEKKEEPIKDEEVPNENVIAHDSMEEKEVIEDEEVLNDDVNTGMKVGDMVVEDSANDSLFNNDDVTQGTIHHSDYMEDGMHFDEEMTEDRNIDMTEQDPANELEYIDDVNGTGQSEKPSEMKKGRRSTRVASKPLQYKETDEDSEEDDEPTRKKSKSQPEKIKGNMKMSSTKSSQSESAKAVKMNDTELKCPECEFLTKSVGSWENHLYRVHSTNAKQASVALRCACGVDCFTDRHFRTCKIARATIIKMNDMKESGAKRNDTELECPECEYHSNSAGGWMAHLRKIHSTTPGLAGLVLRCDCGHESFSEAHTLVCESTNVVVVRKKDGPIRRIQDQKETPKCVLCEVYPSTIVGFAYHLQRHHHTTLKECDGRSFTLHKLDEDGE